MPLSGTWTLYFDNSCRYTGFLCDPCNDASFVARYMLAIGHGELNEYMHAKTLEEAAETRRWRDGSPAERLKMRIERLVELRGLWSSGSAEAAKISAEIAALQKQLKAAA